MWLFTIFEPGIHAGAHSLRFYNVWESLLADGQLDNVTEYASAFRRHTTLRRPTTRHRHTTSRPAHRVLPLSGVMGKLSKLITTDELDTHTHTHTHTRIYPRNTVQRLFRHRLSCSFFTLEPSLRVIPSAPTLLRRASVCLHILYAYKYIYYVLT